MISVRHISVTVVLVTLLGSCAPAPETVKIAPASTESKEVIYQKGHQLLLQRDYAAAVPVLEKAAKLDPTYSDPVYDLGMLFYEKGISNSGKDRIEEFRTSLRYLERAEFLGVHSSELLERLCELSGNLKEPKLFVKYARKNAEAFPYERQHLNLGVAYFESGDYQDVISSQKAAIEKFKRTSYVGGFYRQLGRAYMKIDRDQTAERTFDAGLKAIEEYLSETKKKNSQFAETDDYRRLIDDKIGMLISLRHLHLTYNAQQKLAKVEQQLKLAGYQKN